MQENNNLVKCLNDLKIDVAEIKTMLNERKQDLPDLESKVEGLAKDVQLLQHFHAVAKELPHEVDHLKKFVWKLSGGILFIAVLIESVVLWMTRQPMQ